MLDIKQVKKSWKNPWQHECSNNHRAKQEKERAKLIADSVMEAIVISINQNSISKSKDES